MVDVKEVLMIRWTARIAFFAVVLMLASFPVANSHSHSSGPYLSALNSVGVGTGWAAKKNCNSYCEFIAPGYHCLNEGVNEKCQTGTGGCTTVACN